MKISRILPWLVFLILISIISFVAFNIFNPKTHIVSFDTNGGIAMEDITVRDKNTLSSIPKPMREGYSFEGWYLNDLPFTNENKIEEDITLIAKWKKDDREYFTITFDSLEGSEIKSITVASGTILENYPEPIKSGYTFKGWYYQNKIFDLKTPINSNIILVAKWDK